MLCTCILNNDHILHSKCAGSSFTKWLCHEKHYYFKSLVKPVACTGLALKKPGPVGPRKNRRLESTNLEIRMGLRFSESIGSQNMKCAAISQHLTISWNH